jgi:hypothetical protein
LPFRDRHRGNAQLGVRQELSEAHLPVGPLNRPFGANIETNPAELEPNGNGAKPATTVTDNARRHNQAPSASHHQ